VRRQEPYVENAVTKSHNITWRKSGKKRFDFSVGCADLCVTGCVSWGSPGVRSSCCRWDSDGVSRSCECGCGWASCTCINATKEILNNCPLMRTLHTLSKCIFLTAHWNLSLCERSPPSGSSTQNPSQAWHGSRWHGPPGLAGSQRADGTRGERHSAFQTNRQWWWGYFELIGNTRVIQWVVVSCSYLLPVAGQLFIRWEVRRGPLVVRLANEHWGWQVKSRPSSDWHEEPKGLWHVRILINKQKQRKTGLLTHCT